MRTIQLTTKIKNILADTVTPVSLFLKIRDVYPNTVLLESSDYHSNSNSYSFIGLKPEATFMTENGEIKIELPGEKPTVQKINRREEVVEGLKQFIDCFQISGEKPIIDGVFGYTSYDAIKYFEDIEPKAPVKPAEYIPEVRYSFYKYIIAINHLKNEMQIIEFLLEGEQSKINDIESLLEGKTFAVYNFDTLGNESSNMTDDEYKHIVSKGKEHCFRGDVFQIVLSRQFKQQFKGDDFNVYRSLRSINPSPYLFYFDYGSYKIFGSSPEAQIEIKNNKAYINPIAGTFKRTGNDDQDLELAEQLSNDPKENAEHIMLVDLARNDLSRTTSQVKVEKYREIQFYSHVIHMVSKVSGILPPNTNTIQTMAESFPAGTLSGAPKYKAMELIDMYENKSRGYYGGCIGLIRFNGDINQAITIRTFLSKDNTLYYQAGAGVVSESKEENELNEVNNKLAALKKAVEMAKTIK